MNKINVEIHQTATEFKVSITGNVNKEEFVLMNQRYIKSLIHPDARKLRKVKGNDFIYKLTELDNLEFKKK